MPVHLNKHLSARLRRKSHLILLPARSLHYELFRSISHKCTVNTRGLFNFSNHTIASQNKLPRLFQTSHQEQPNMVTDAYYAIAVLVVLCVAVNGMINCQCLLMFAIL